MNLAEWTKNQLKRIKQEILMDGLMNFSRMETRALLYCHFCNKMKKENYIPDFVRFADVTPKYKGNGSKKDFLNERGIFVVTILRSLLMKLIYQDYYSIIDKSNSQI